MSMAPPNIIHVLPEPYHCEFKVCSDHEDEVGSMLVVNKKEEELMKGDALSTTLLPPPKEALPTATLEDAMPTMDDACCSMATAAEMKPSTFAAAPVVRQASSVGKVKETLFTKPQVGVPPLARTGTGLRTPRSAPSPHSCGRITPRGQQVKAMVNRFERSKSKDQDYDVKAIPVCCDHPDKKLELFCRIHLQRVCASCTYTTHWDCVKAFFQQHAKDGHEDLKTVSPFVSIDDAILEFPREMLAYPPSETLKAEEETPTSQLQSQKKALETQLADMTRQIMDHHDQLITKLVRRRVELVDTLTMSTQAKLRALEQGGDAASSATDGADLRLYLPPSEQLLEELKTRGWAGVFEADVSNWSLQGPSVISYPSKSSCVVTLESSIEGDRIPHSSLMTARARTIMKNGSMGPDVPVTIISKDDGKVYEISFEATEDLVGRYVEVEATITDKAVGGGPKRVAVVNNTLGSMVFFDPAHLPGFLSLMRFVPGKTWRLLYRASRDGWSASDFHSRCDKKGATVILAKTSGDNPSIFGGYTSESWESTPKATYKKDPTAFLFSLVNTADMDPLKLKLLPKAEGKAIVCEANYGPAFGKACDLFLGDNPNVSSHMNRALLGSTYEVPKGVKDASTFLAGSEKFTLEEMEVYQLV